MDGEWVFVLLYLLLWREHSGAGTHDLRTVVDAYWYLLCAEFGSRLLPGDLPRWKAMYAQRPVGMRRGSEPLLADGRGLIAWARARRGIRRRRCSTRETAGR